MLGVKDHDKNTIGGDLEIKYESKKNGLAVTNAWTTSNTLRNHIELDGHVAKGLKFESVSFLQPEKQTKSIVLASLYKQPGVFTRQHVDLFKVRRSQRQERQEGIEC